MKREKTALEVARLCSRALEEKKAGDVVVLDVSKQSSITDYLVVATATSAPHLLALRIEIERTLDAYRVQLVGKEEIQGSGWVVLDAFHVMIHVFLGEARNRYGLERLWRDSLEVTGAQLINQRRPRSRSTAGRKAPPRR